MLVILLLITLLCFGFVQITYAETIPGEVKIEAEGGVNFDLDKNITTASKKVKLSNTTVLIEAEELVYNGNTGLVTASGGVKLTTDTGVYNTEAISYNLKENRGSLDSFQGSLEGKGRDYQLNGGKTELQDGQGSVSKAGITRCELLKPEYLFSAGRVVFDKDKIKLYNVTLFLKGIPVFYLPFLTFETEERKVPDIRVGYENDDGLKLSFRSFTPVSDQLSSNFSGDISTHGDSEIGTGVAINWGKLSNSLDALYFFDGYLGYRDTLVYNSDSLNITIDASKEFSDEEKTELGFSATRKYFPTPLGQWQVGLLARRVSAIDDLDQKYGGTYWGYRFDYAPYSNLTLSYLWLDSLEEKGTGYGDFLDDYSLGGNLFYNWRMPLSKTYALSLSGTYSYSEAWKSRIFGIVRETDCIRLMFGWDFAEDAPVWMLQLKF